MPDKPDAGQMLATTGCAMMSCPFVLLFGGLLLLFVYLVLAMMFG